MGSFGVNPIGMTGLLPLMSLDIYQPNQRVTVDLSNVTIQGVSCSQNVEKAPAGQESRETTCRLFRTGRKGRLESVRRAKQCRRSRTWVHIGNPG